jgi:hypothetical protein
MNNTAKIILGLVAGAVVLCLCIGVSGLVLFRSTGWAVREAFNTDANDVKNVSASIAEYTLPEGFEGGTTMQVAGFDMVSYTGNDGYSHIYFFQLPAGVQLDPAEMERKLRETAGEPGGNTAQGIEVVDQIPATIRGQETTPGGERGREPRRPAFPAGERHFPGGRWAGDVRFRTAC